MSTRRRGTPRPEPDGPPSEPFMELTYRPVPSESGTVRELEMVYRRAGATLTGVLTFKHPEDSTPAEADKKVALTLALLLSDLDRVYQGALSSQLAVKVEWK